MTKPTALNPMQAGLLAAAGETVFQLGLIDPLAVCRALAKALRRQTAGAKAMIVRRLCDELDHAEPGCLRQVASELSQHYWERT